MAYTLIKTPRDLDLAIEKISQAPILAGDCETTSLHPRNGKLRLLQLSDGNNIYLIDFFAFDNNLQVAEKIKPILESASIKKIFHNLSFDAMWLYEKLGISIKTYFDSIIASRLVDFPAKHKLSQVALRYLNVNLDKTEQKSDWSGILTQDQLQYAADDVKYLIPLREVLLKEIIKTEQLDALKFELELVPVVAHMQLKGFCLNKSMYSNLLDRNIEEMKKRKDILEEFLKTRGGTVKAPDTIVQDSLFGDESFQLETDNDININSPSQLLPIYKEMGVPIESTAKKFIEAMSADYPQLQPLLDYREYSKLVSTYGQSIIDMIDNDRIYTSFNQLGTITFRFSSFDPNLQQQPSSKVFRECFCTPAGRKLAQADFSGIELRILADFSNDKVMLTAFEDNMDLHSLTASTVFNVPYQEVVKGAKTLYKDQRDASKQTNFAVSYGISPKMLRLRIKGKGVECTEEGAKEFIDGFYRAYPDAGRWLFARERVIEKNPNIRTPESHLIKLVFDKDDKISFGGAKRDSRNFPIQSLSAMITKRSMIMVHNELMKSYPTAHISNTVHDEIIIECDEKDASEVATVLEKNMVISGEHYLKRVKIVAEAGVADSWAEK